MFFLERNKLSCIYSVKIEMGLAKAIYNRCDCKGSCDGVTVSEMGCSLGGWGSCVITNAFLICV